MRTVSLALFVSVVFVTCSLSQSYRSTVTEGNDLYRAGKFEPAGKKFDAAIEEDPARVEGYFNRGNAAYRSDDAPKAIGSYTKAGEFARSREEGARLWYNGGNTLMKSGDYAAAIEAYKQSLKLNPNDEDARYNLLYAMKKLAEQQQQNRNQKQDKQKQQDQKQDKNKDQNQQQDQQQNKDQQQNEKQQQQEQQQQQQKQDPKRMSKQQAEQILKALERDEKDLQKKLKERRVSRYRVEKDW